MECVQVVYKSVDLIERLLDRQWEEPHKPVTPCKGGGVGAVEVPRGILYHAYEFDSSGRITHADCVIPTSQNNANIHHDLHELARQSVAAGGDDQEIRRLAEMLVHSYDPYISCSVH